MTPNAAPRREMLGLLGAMAPLLLARSGLASPIDRSETQYTLPPDIPWHRRPTDPPNSIDQAPLFGATTGQGLYYVLIRWWPGYMSAPHMYDTDRLCVVVSGTWWINSGADFDPDRTVPVPAGTFVHRIAHTPHYDGVKRGERAPAVIAICGIAPVHYQAVDPSRPEVRAV